VSSTAYVFNIAGSYSVCTFATVARQQHVLVQDAVLLQRWPRDAPYI